MTENMRLQRMVDILDSQPEIIFAVNTLGQVTFASERTMNYMKMSSTSSSLSKELNSKVDDNSNHVSNFLAPESLDALLDSITYLNSSSTSIPSNSSDGSSDQESLISPVKVSFDFMNLNNYYKIFNSWHMKHSYYQTGGNI